MAIATDLDPTKTMTLEAGTIGCGRDDGDGCAEEEDIGRAFRYDHSALP